MEIPTFKLAIESVSEFVGSHSSKLTPSQNKTLLEIKRRLERLDIQLRKLLEINEKLILKEDFKISFDQPNDTIVISMGGQEQRIKLKRADPNIPITLNNLTRGSAYQAGSASSRDDEEHALRIELETELESYYQSAHKVLKLFGTIPEFTKIKSLSITRVRNNLIEHTKNGAVYSFGVGSTGPRVKPMYEGELVFNDEGLVPNTREFIDAIEKYLKQK